MKLGTVLAALVLHATLSNGATWHVAQDGSGDFTAIQPAVDAASPGDVIQIHAGRYVELNEDHDMHGDGTAINDCHIAVETDNLTLRGEGAGLTIIGPAAYPDDPDDGYSGIMVSDTFVDRLTVTGITVENTRYGVLSTCPTLDFSACRFEGIRRQGFYIRAASLAMFDTCDFVDCVEGGLTFSPSANVTVSECHFTDCLNGLLIAGTENVQVISSEFDCAFASANIQQGSYGTIRDCTMLARDQYGYGISVSLAGDVQVYDCEISGGDRGIIVGDVSSLYCERVSLSSQTYASVRVFSSGQVAMHDCDIYNGGGWSVECEHAGDESECSLDMENNYWGTDSQAQIEEWIYDSAENPDLCCTVDFIPFDGMVATEAHSWSGVKGLFRGDGE